MTYPSYEARLRSLWRLTQIAARRMDRENPRWWNDGSHSWIARLDPIMPLDRMWQQLIQQRKGH